MRTKQPDVQTIIPIDNRDTQGPCLMVIVSDFANEEVLTRYFESLPAALEWAHESSLIGFPKWHSEHCTRCAK